MSRLIEQNAVVVVGDALIDEIHKIASVDEFVGGAALNVAVGLVALGIPATLLAMIGDDSDGERIRSYLTAHGVKLIATIGPNGTARAVSERVNGEPTYRFNDAARARQIRFGPEEIAELDAARLVVVSSFPFDDVEQSTELINAVTDPRARLVIDPNPRAGLLHDRATFASTFDRLASDTLMVKVGDDDSALVYGTDVGELSVRLLADGASTVLATAGRHGASVRTAGGMIVSEPIAVLDGAIVDTMGAGDATLASVVQSLVEQDLPTSRESWHALLSRAMLVAGATCRSEGALIQLPGAPDLRLVEG